MLGKYYEHISVGVGIIQAKPDSKDQKVIGLSFPLEIPVRPDDLGHEDNFEDVFIPVSAAKALLIDLRDAVDSIVDGSEFE